MPFWVTLLLPLFLLALAWTLFQRERRQYRAAAEIGSDLFVYSRGRFVRRMVGIAMLAAMALTFAGLGLMPPRSAEGASAYLGALIGEVLVLVVLPIWDLVETARTARPGQGESYGRKARADKPTHPPR